jgi:hypothetical protein
MLQEFLIVLAYSKRTQLALVLGVVFALVLWVAGEYLVGRISFVGPLAPLTAVVREKLMHRYDKAALLCFLGFLALAAKSYLRDRKRLLQL